MKTKVLAGLTLASMSAYSFAGTIDTTEVVQALKDAGTAAGVVGAASLVVVIGIKAFHMIRRAA